MEIRPGQDRYVVRCWVRAESDRDAARRGLDQVGEPFLLSPTGSVPPLLREHGQTVPAEVADRILPTVESVQFTTEHRHRGPLLRRRRVSLDQLQMADEFPVLRTVHTLGSGIHGRHDMPTGAPATSGSAERLVTAEVGGSGCGVALQPGALVVGS